MNILCRLGIHDWGRWWCVDGDTQIRECRRCHLADQKADAMIAARKETR